MRGQRQTVGEIPWRSYVYRMFWERMAMNKESNPATKRVSHSARYAAIPPEQSIRYAKRCPVCAGPMYDVRVDKSYVCKCFNASCGLVVSLDGIPGGEKSKGNEPYRDTRYLGLEKLPPTPPWEVPNYRLSGDLIMDTRRMSPMAREWRR